jgi:hypothetical protein
MQFPKIKRHNRIALLREQRFGCAFACRSAWPARESFHNLIVKLLLLYRTKAKRVNRAFDIGRTRVETRAGARGRRSAFRRHQNRPFRRGVMDAFILRRRIAEARSRRCCHGGLAFDVNYAARLLQGFAMPVESLKEVGHVTAIPRQGTAGQLR